MTDERLPPASKSATAFRTIGELAAELGIAQHVLRYWENRFPQLKPLQRAGNRRLYRPADVALVRRIHGLLDTEGYSIRGVQKLLADGAASAPAAAEPLSPVTAPTPTQDRTAFRRAELAAIRQLLVDAIADVDPEPASPASRLDQSGQVPRN